VTDLVSRAITAVAPHADVAKWASALAPFMTASGITTPRRIAAFVGQVAWESTQFTQIEENLNYSAERLMAVWPTRFPRMPDLLAQRCAHNPEFLANVVYCDRMGNGDEESGDGYRYRGAGLIQLTGHDNHAKFASAAKQAPATVGDYLRTSRGAAQSAVWFWQTKGLNRYADLWLLTQLTSMINGGTDGLSQRIAFCNAALKACSAPVVTAPPAAPEISADDLMNIYNPTVGVA
jgi:putative chitinase